MFLLSTFMTCKTQTKIGFSGLEFGPGWTFKSYQQIGQNNGESQN